ncbi:testis-expressed protein 9 isoform X2 [Anabrus simplex]|uniref:testis-expressed protein 9 isoform X2 n=1 Tax=Anabrus simplex TaxID=316456 RepID=UPI0034DD4EB6
MEKELLRKEEEFHKLNAELELKTSELMKEVECVMKIKDELTKKTSLTDNTIGDYVYNSSYDDHIPVSNNEYSLKETKKRFGPSKLRTGVRYPCYPLKGGFSVDALRSRSQDVGSRVEELPDMHEMDRGERTKPLDMASGLADDFLPETTQGMGAEAIIRLFRAKGKLLQEECFSLQKECKKQSEELRRMHAEQRLLEEDRKRWQQQANVSKEQSNRLEQSLATSNKKLGEKEAENNSLKKELESLKKEMKQTTQTYGNNEIRLNRALEEVEKLKSALKHAKLEEKELRESTRKKNEEFTANIKRLEKQKLELVTAFKKQLQLVDNLKKQKAHLEASRVVQFTEEEFLKLLEWNPEKQ